MKNKTEKIRSRHIHLKNDMDMMSTHIILQRIKKELIIVNFKDDVIDIMKHNYSDESKASFFYDILTDSYSSKRPLIIIDVKDDYSIELKSKYLSHYNLNIPFTHRYIVDKLMVIDNSDLNNIIKKVKLKLYFGDII